MYETLLTVLQSTCTPWAQCLILNYFFKRKTRWNVALFGWSVHMWCGVGLGCVFAQYYYYYSLDLRSVQTSFYTLPLAPPTALPPNKDYTRSGALHPGWVGRDGGFNANLCKTPSPPGRLKVLCWRDVDEHNTLRFDASKPVRSPLNALTLCILCETRASAATTEFDEKY